LFFFFSSRRRHTRFSRDWSSDVCSSDLIQHAGASITGGSRFRKPSFTTLSASSVGFSNDLQKTEKAGVSAGFPVCMDRTQRGSEIGRASCRERVEVLEVYCAHTRK